MDVVAKLVSCRTNSRALRDREYGIPKLPARFRVAVMGASSTIASGVEIEDAFHSLLETGLSVERAPTTYEFINCAIPAMGSSQVVAMRRAVALPQDPDLVLIGVTAQVAPYYLLEWHRTPAELPPELRWPPRRLIAMADRSAPGFRSYLIGGR
jgi:hypothetical protein